MSVTVEAPPQALAEPKLPKADPCTIIIFGASGDLTKRKLLPALYTLNLASSLDESFHVLGIGQDQMTDQRFRDSKAEGGADDQEGTVLSPDKWGNFEQRLFYIQGELTDQETYRTIAERLGGLAKQKGATGNHLFYFSTPPSLAPSIVQGLGAAGLAGEESGWSRIIVEKPFGRDLESACQLNREIAKIFQEKQVYRIDHYLGKETVQNLMVFRFGNSLFEPVWNRNYIDFVEITAAETLGVGTRAGYYEEAGALRDMVANHLLQLLALTAMEPPIAFDADSVREQKVQIFRSIRTMSVEDVARFTVRGQYGAGVIDGKPVPGYRQEPGVNRSSVTETYAAVRFQIENWRWAGVPFYIRTGKRLARNLTEIRVHLKPTPQALFASTSSGIDPNVITISIQPDEGISIAFDAKRPGTQMRTVMVQANFSYQASFGSKGPVAYETLLLDSMRGDATLFTRRDEVEAEWRIITPIEEAWAQLPPPDFPNYAAGTEGPPSWQKLFTIRGNTAEPAIGQ